MTECELCEPNESKRHELLAQRSIREWTERALTAEAEIEKLQVALKPFAAWIDKVDTAAPSESTTDNNRTCLINGSAVVTYGDFRRAAQALEQKAPEKQEG